MNPEVKKLWVDALRSGEYHQTKDRLKSDDGYCCLGVLCELAVEAGVIPPFVNEEFGWVIHAESDSHVEAVLPWEVAEWSGLGDNNPLIQLSSYDFPVPISDPNDAGMPFEEIAKLIEEQL